MLKSFLEFLKYVVLILFVLYLIYPILSWRKRPDSIQYGVTFSPIYASELGLDWQETYLAVLDELNVKRIRLSAYWTDLEKSKDQYDFSKIDFEIKEAEKRGVRVILAVGRRLPRWPECHIPNWAQNLSWERSKMEILELIEMVVMRYKNSSSLEYWQVENEPFLNVYAKDQCGKLDEDFLEKEINLVKSLDPNRSVLVTDSDNLSLWFKAYKSGDLFGTTGYLYMWNKYLGAMKSFVPASFYRLKANLLGLFFGKKEVILVELSAEPWLDKPITEVPIEKQFERMSPKKFDKVIDFARKTHFSKQYLWGVEWWYWLNKKGNPVFWDKAKALFKEN